jgi:protein BCP1
VDFEFYDPKVEDFHGVKALVRLYLDDDSWDISGFVDTILAQTTVGSVIKTGEDESPIGIITALNIGRYKVPIHHPKLLFPRATRLSINE